MNNPERCDLPFVVLSAEKFRLVRLPRESDYIERNFVIERKDGTDAMGETRWIANVEFDPAAFGWLIKQLGVIKDDEILKSIKGE